MALPHPDPHLKFSLISNLLLHAWKWQSLRAIWVRGWLEVEEQSCWAKEGGRVNYSITGWLRQELFKQAPVSRGLGLITPAKVAPTTLPHHLLLQVYLQNIHKEWGGCMKEGKRVNGGVGEWKQSKQASTALNSSPELSLGYNYPPKCPCVARLGSGSQVTLPSTAPNRMAIFCHRLLTILPQVSDGTWW